MMWVAPALIGLFFIVLGVIFLGLATRDSVKNRGSATPARKAWLRVGLIFSAVGVFLYVFHTYFQARPK
jgi:hypothetical protein